MTISALPPEASRLKFWRPRRMEEKHLGQSGRCQFCGVSAGEPRLGTARLPCPISAHAPCFQSILFLEKINQKKGRGEGGYPQIIW